MDKCDVKSWIASHTEEYIRDVGKLISYPSVSTPAGEEEMPYGKACRDVLEEALAMGRKCGFQSFNHENRCGTLLWPGEISGEVGIFGHLDVVPEGPGWKYRPYQLTLENGFLIGRGCADNKGSLTSVFYALRYLKEHGYQPKHSIRLYMGCSEERSMEDLEYYVEHYPLPLCSIVADSVFPVCYGEKGILEIQASAELESRVLKDFHAGIASNSIPALAECILETRDKSKLEKLKSRKDVQVTKAGDGLFHITVHGIAAHAAFPEGSESAEVKLADILLKSEVLDPAGEKLMRSVCCLFGDYYGEGLGVPYEDDVSGKLTHIGGMVSVKENKICQDINIRYNIKADYDLLLENIRMTLKENGFHIDSLRNSAPTYTDPESPMVRLLSEIVEKYYPGQKPFVMGGGTYARKLRNAVGFGPGNPNALKPFGTERGGGHQPDECIELKELLTAMEIYIEAIPKLDALAKENTGQMA